MLDAITNSHSTTLKTQNIIFDRLDEMKLVKTTILFFILFLTLFVTQKVYASNHTLSESEVNELISKANENDITSQIELHNYYYDLEKYE